MFRYSLEALEGWMAAAGYELDRSFDFVEENFFVIYRRRAPGLAGVAQRS
ncbi:MAG: hypothetical protein V3T72_22530 [Thermoanaerobaculia bacterium]